MFDQSGPSGSGGGVSAPEVPLAASDVTAWTAVLASRRRAADDVARIDEIRALEDLKNAAAARQAELAVDFDASQRSKAAAKGVPVARQHRGIAEQIGLARRCSPHRARSLLGLAKVLRTELPHARAAFNAGKVSEWTVTLLAKETACLEADDRASVDQILAKDAARFEAMSAAEVGDRAAGLAAKLDAASVTKRRRRAEADRAVTLRPAPDTMAYLTALLPVAEAVAAYAALKQKADTARAQGDARSRGQVMADTLVERVTGQTRADDARVAVNLVMTDRTLFGTGDDPAHLEGYGSIPAELARELVKHSLHSKERTWLRRLFADPQSGELVAADARSRLFPEGLAWLIRLRDRFCRTPWCDAPIRHTDHTVEHDAGGQTSLDNGQGLCEQCNHAKQAPGWRARPLPGPGHLIETTTPTGHSYRSRAPALVGFEARRQQASPMETYVFDLVLAV